MATLDEVRGAIGRLGVMLDDADPDVRRRIPDRSVSVWIKDLDVAFAGALRSGELVDIEQIDTSDRRSAQLKLTMSSDDLIEVVEGRLHFGSGWAHGRIKVDARLRDVLELRKFL